MYYVLITFGQDFMLKVQELWVNMYKSLCQSSSPVFVSSVFIQVIECYVTQCLSVQAVLWVCKHQPAAAVSLYIMAWMTKAVVELWSLLTSRTLIRWDVKHEVCVFFFYCQVNLSAITTETTMGSFFICLCFDLPPLGFQSEAGVREFHIVQVSSSSQNWRLYKCINPAKDKGL